MPPKSDAATAVAPSIPAIAGMEHVGLTVPDLDAATRFFIDVLGGEPLYDIGPFVSPDDWMAVHLVVHPRAHIHRLRVLRIANGPTLELFELASEAQASSSPPMGASPTGWHMAFYVEDMDRALAALKAHGAEIQSGPVTMTQGPSAGLTWLYFSAPWGLQLELVSYPEGITAYKQLSKPVWRPNLSPPGLSS